MRESETILTGYAEAEIEDLQAEGITLTPAEIVKINALAGAVENPESDLQLARGIPVFVGGVTLWPRTLYALDWYERVGCKVRPPRLRRFALAYSMAYPRGQLPSSINAASLDVREFSKSLRCTARELDVAMMQCCDDEWEPDLPQRDDDKSMSVGEFSAFLAAATGTGADYWERRCTFTYARSVLCAIVQQNRADGTPSNADPRIRANLAFDYYEESIRQRHREETEETEQ